MPIVEVDGSTGATTVPTVFPSWVSIRSFCGNERLWLAKRPFVARILTSMKIEERPYVIAIVDDDQRVLESLGELLESAGYSARLFDSAEAFLQADAVKEIDALISDIRMPDVSGFDFRRVVRHRFPGLPMVLITGIPVTSEDVVPRDTAILQKPVAASDLHQVILDLRNRVAGDGTAR